MSEPDFRKINSQIPGPDETAVRESLARWSVVAKPLKGFGVLEDFITRIAGVVGMARFSIEKRALVVLCADNGVVARGVAQTDESVTSIVAASLADGRSAANLMAQSANCDVIPVDMGIKNPPLAAHLLNRRIAAGTCDFTTGPAMTREQAVRSIETGIELARKCKMSDYSIIAGGEMGIGNTTTSAAVASVLLDCPPEKMTGRGAGLSSKGLERKIAAIRLGISVNSPNPDDPLDVLSKLGGFDIAGLTGLFIGGALHRLPVVIDGIVSVVAALVASRLCPACAGAMLPSHLSAEPAARKIFKELRLKPPIQAGMHLGEGTGALCLFPLLDMAMSVYDGLVFSDLGMKAYKPQT